MKSGVIHFYSNTSGTPQPGASTYLFPAGANGSDCPLQFNFPIRLFNLYGITPQPPGIGEKYIYEVMLNGLSTPLSIVIDNQNLIGMNRINSVSLAAGEWPLIRLTLSANALPTFYAGSVEWEEVTGSAWRPVAFSGDSITGSWFYPGSIKAFNRGVAGRTTPEMAAAFADEVMSLQPSTVVLLGGSNDLRLIEGPTVSYLESMGVAAQNSGARVIIGTIPPIGPSSPYQPVYLSVEDWNNAVRNSAINLGFELVDYYEAMTPFNPDQFVPDQLHPSAAGYEVMKIKLSSVL